MCIAATSKSSDDRYSTDDFDAIVLLIPRSATCPGLLCESRKRDGIPTLLFSYRIAEGN